jgi:hypothetical protein
LYLAGGAVNFPICWDTIQVQAVFTTESRQKARDLFMRTHRPFRRIRVDFCKEVGVGERFIDEMAVRELIERGPLEADNRLFFVVGEAGSGKSELCQWLEYTVDPRSRLIVHIPRGMVSAAHVVALLRRRLGSEAATVLQRTPLTLQADYIALAATVLLYEQAPLDLTPVHQWEEVFASGALRQTIMAHLVAAEQGDLYHCLFATSDEFVALCTAVGITLDEGEILVSTLRAFRALLDQALEQTLWMGDLRLLLSRLCDTAVARGQRPLLLLEDITAFRTLGDRLLDYLLDLTSGHFDAVIGVTTGFEHTQLAQATLSGDLTHIHHRLRARFVLTDEHGRTYGLEEEFVELARGYLQAVKPACDTCPLRRECDAVFGPGLYPFTELSLQRALHSLSEEGNPRQTPRLFIEHVLGATLLASELPPLTLDRSTYLVNPPALFRSDDVADKHLSALLRWYGTIDETTISLDRRLADFWAVPLANPPTGAIAHFERAYITPSLATPSAISAWEQELRELQRWLTVGGMYPSRETLKRGIEQALFIFGDPRALKSPDSMSLARAELFYARGDEHIPIALGRGSGDQPITRTALKVRVSGTSAERTILEELAYSALSNTPLIQVSRNIASSLAWVSDHWQVYHGEIRELLRSYLGGMEAEALVLIAWQLVTALQHPITDSLPDLRAERTTNAPYVAHTPWSAAQHWACYSAGEQLYRWHETLRRLFIGFFTLRDTLIDHERYTGACQHLDRNAALRTLAALPLPSLRAMPFKIRPTGQKLYELLAVLQRYSEALLRCNVETALHTDQDELRRKIEHLQAQHWLEPALLREQIAGLRWRCAEVGVTWRESWDASMEALIATTETELQQLEQQITKLQYAIEQHITANSADLWQYQNLRHALRPVIEHPYWAAEATLNEIMDALGRTARSRYRSSGKALAGTAAYKQLLATVRQIQAELNHA